MSYLFLLGNTIAPTIATNNKMDVTSNGSRKLLNDVIAIARRLSIVFNEASGEVIDALKRARGKT